MKEVETVFDVIDKLIGTPLYLLMCIGLIVFFVYYFWKVAPARYKAFEDLIRDNAKQTSEIEKISSQYEKALENSNRVIENNTAALKSTQSMLELFNSKIDTNILKTDEISRITTDFSDKINDLNVAIAVTSEQIKKNQ